MATFNKIKKSKTKQAFYFVLFSVIQLYPTLYDPTDLLCMWNFPGKNTGLGCHFLPQGILPTQSLNPHPLRLLHLQADSLPLSHLGSTSHFLYWGIAN